MARPLRSSTFISDSNQTSITIPIPAHASGNDLMVLVNHDYLNDTLATVSTNWTKEQETSGKRSTVALFVNRAASSSEVDLVVTGTNGEWSAVVIVMDGAHATTTYTITESTQTVAWYYDTPSVTPSETNVYIVEAAFSQSINGMVFEPDTTQIAAATNYNCSLAVAGYTHQQASVATTSHRCRQTYTSTRYGHAWTIEVRDDGNAEIDAYQDPTDSPATLVHGLFESGYSAELGTSPDADPTGAVPTLEGTTATFQAVTTNVPLALGPRNGAIDNCNHQLYTADRHEPSITRVPLASTQDLSAAILSFNHKVARVALADWSIGGMYFGLITGTTTGADVWKMASRDSVVTPLSGTFPYVFETTETPYESHGTPNNASVSDIMFGFWSEYSNDQPAWAFLYSLLTMKIIGGSTAGEVASFSTAVKIASSAGLSSVQAQGGQATSQFYAHQNIQIGNGARTVIWDSTSQAIEFPAAADVNILQMHCQVSASAFTLSVYASANCDITLDKTTVNLGNLHNFLINASTSGSAAYSMEGLTLISGTITLNDIGQSISGVTFTSCKEITKNSADLSGGCTIDACVDAQAFTITSEADWDDLQNCVFTNQSALSVLITGNQSGTWSGVGMTVSGGAGSYDIEYTGTTNFTIEMDTGTTWRENNSSSGVLTISAPTTDVTINSNVASSDIKIFDGGTTQTATANTTGTTLAYTYSGTKTWFYTVQKAGYVPQQGSIVGTNETLTVNISLVVDPVYAASHGLTYTTDYAYNITTRVLTVVAAQQGRDLYSSMVDEFISNSGLYNRPFPFTAIGPDRIDFTSDGTTAATLDSGDVAFWRGAGMEWEHATLGTQTHKFCSLVGTGTNAGSTKGYSQQVDGASPAVLTLVSNNIDQVLQYYSDPNGDGSVADGYDYSGHLVVKLFNDGYYQVSSDVLVAYGITAIESFEYVLPLQMLSTGLGTGTRSITIVVTDNTPAGVAEQIGYTFDYKLEGGASDSPEDLLRQWIYDVFTDPTASTYAATVNFNWPDPLLESGGSYETQYGYVYGQDTTTTFHGFYVEEGSGYHPDLLRQQANDGTYFVTPVPTPTFTVNASESGSDIKIFETGTQTIEAQATGTTANTTTAATYDITVMKAGFLPQRQTALVLGTSSVTISITLLEDPAYNSSHGLTFTTDYSYSRATRIMTVVAAQQGRDLYSALIDDFISVSGLDNSDFPLQAIGPDRFDFTSDGTTAATLDSGDIAFWRGAGMEWEHATTGNKTHKFCSIKGSGINAAGTKGYYQYAAGSGTTALTLVSNNIDQVLQYYSDPNGDGSVADGYDRSAHLVVKLFNIGYYQRRQDVLTSFGIAAVESFEYILDFQMTSFDFSSGDQGITIATLTDDTGAPTDPGSSGNAFSYELVDPGANTGEALAAQLNYDIFTDPTATLYTSYTAFNLPDIIVSSGGVNETEEGWVEDQSDALGFYVSRSAADHPDFLRYEDDDGTYYVIPVVATIAGSGMPTTGADIRLQVTNVAALTASAWAATTAYSLGDKVLRSTGLGIESSAGLYMVCTTAGTSNTLEPTWSTTVGVTSADTNGTGAGDVVWTTYAILFYDADPGGATAGPTYTNGEEFSTGDAIRVRFAELDGATSFSSYETSGIVASTGFSFVVAVEAESIYADNSVDGSLVAMFTADFTNDEIDLSADTDFSALQAFAFYCYVLTTSNGMHSFWGGVTAIDHANYRINTAIVNIYFNETIGAFIKQSDSARIYRDDDVRPAKDPTTGGYGIEINWRNPVFAYDGGGGGFTASDRAVATSTSSNASAILLDTDTTIPALIGTPAVDLAADIASASAPSAAAIADAVFDEPVAGHAVSGSFGAEFQTHALSSEIAAVQTGVNDILDDTGTVGVVIAPGQTVATVTTLTGHTAQTGDNYARLGAPVGASHAADIADVPNQVWEEDTTAHTTVNSYGNYVRKKLLTLGQFIGLG